MKLCSKGQDNLVPGGKVVSICHPNLMVVFNMNIAITILIQGVFLTGTPLKVPSTKKLILARLGVSGPIYVDVDSPNLGFPYFNFLV